MEFFSLPRRNSRREAPSFRRRAGPKSLSVSLGDFSAGSYGYAFSKKIVNDDFTGQEHRNEEKSIYFEVIILGREMCHRAGKYVKGDGYGKVLYLLGAVHGSDAAERM